MLEVKNVRKLFTKAILLWYYYLACYGNEVPLDKMVYEPYVKYRKGVPSMNLQLVNDVTKSQLKKDIPFFKSGSTVRVHVKIKEGDKSRIQVFEGLVIARQGGGISENFTVRKISNQIGVERTFPIHSPIIDKIEVIRHGKVRRNKLFYLRGRSGKASRIKEIRK